MQLEKDAEGYFRGKAPEGFVEVVAEAGGRRVRKPMMILPGMNRFLLPMDTDDAEAV